MLHCWGRIPLLSLIRHPKTLLLLQLQLSCMPSIVFHNYQIPQSSLSHQQITVVLIMTTLKLSVLKRLLASTLQIDYYMSVSLMPEA